MNIHNTAVKDALDNISTATYDSMGNITRLAGPLGGATNYVYDKMGRMTSKSTTSGGTVSYTYTAKTLVDELTNARGASEDLPTVFSEEL